MLIQQFGAGCALAALLTVSAAAQSLDASISVKDDDPVMLAAFSKARASLDDFLDKWRHPRSETNTYSVKIGLEDKGNGYAIVHANETVGRKAEFFWLVGLRQDGDGFTASVDNDPDSIHNVRSGEKIKFGKEDIVDWMYLQNGKIKGNFTACPALKNAMDKERKEMMEQYGLSCD